MREKSCDVLIVGGGTGGCAAAMAVCSMGLSAVMTEETDWVGGQLTAQAVPPDESPWIEQFGCTRRYRAYREGVRQFYREHTPLLPPYRQDPRLNPGGGFVSRICHEPRIGWLVLNAMLHEPISRGLLDLRLRTVPLAADAQGDEVRSVLIGNLDTGDQLLVHARYVIDASEMGDLLPMTGTEHVVGAESRRETGEPNATDEANPGDVQGITWCFAMAHDAGSDRTIDKPEGYDRWRAFQPEFWPGPLLGLKDVAPQTLEPRQHRLLEGEWSLFRYRQIVDPEKYGDGRHPVTIVNWPMNDYFAETITDVDPLRNPGVRSTTPYADGPVSAARIQEAKQLSRCVLYWLQTEEGYPGLYMRPDVVGTEDGLAKAAYIRESRRIKARFTVLEQHVAAYTNPGRDRAEEFADSVGVGAYRIDLHPSTSGRNYVDTSSLPFQIPLGSLIPVRVRNLLPGCKNLGVTHITNGCYRLHPVEWNVGESAGLLAASCVASGLEPAEVWESEPRTREFQELVRKQGVETEWPRLHAL
ncbi:MAG TPA: FAD-dependent oxidoreductase [Fimbriimonas sp.]